MGFQLIGRYASVALSAMGSAILLISCESEIADSDPSEDVMLSEYSENLSVIKSENGRRSLLFETPLLEGYTIGKEPYREFRKGIRVTTYEDDSLSTVDVVLVANYAIFYENRNLWEARGDVEVRKADGKTLYTQQLFWNLVTKKVYSNVDSKVVEAGGRNVAYGEGFESDETLSDIRWRKLRSMMTVDVADMSERKSDSVRRVSAGRDRRVGDADDSRPPVGKVGNSPGTSADSRAGRPGPQHPSLRKDGGGRSDFRTVDGGTRPDAPHRRPGMQPGGFRTLGQGDSAAGRAPHVPGQLRKNDNE